MGLGCLSRPEEGTTIEVVVRARCPSNCCTQKKLVLVLPPEALSDVTSALTQLAVQKFATTSEGNGPASA
mgnify:CR=1 FL=1